MITLFARDHLLPVDAEVLPRLVRAARHGEAPGDERPGVAGPAGLHRQAREIDVGAFPDDLLARRRLPLLRRHLHHLHEQRPRVLPRVLQALRRLGLLQEREQLADLAQRRDRLLAHAERDARRRAEQIAEHGNARTPSAPSKPFGFSNSSAGPPAFSTRSQISVISRRGSTSARDALQLAAALELREKVAEVGVFHGGNPVESRRPEAQFTVASRWGQRARAPRPACPSTMGHASGAAPHDPRFIRARRVIFGIALASFVLSFFHRTAPAAIADELARAFAINSALLGTLAATYFYVYMVLQMPVGVLADTMGPRWLLAAGSLVAGLGSIAFALAPIVGDRGGRPHARRRRRLGRLHRDPQGERRLVSGEPVRDVERRHDVRRQSRRGDRGRAARMARDASVVARRVPGPRGAVDRARHRHMAQGARSAGGPRISAGARVAAGRVGEDALGAGAGVRALESGHVARILRQRRHRRQLSRLRGPLGGPLSRADVCDVARRGRAAHEPAAARRRLRRAAGRDAVRPIGAAAAASCASTPCCTRRPGCRGSCTCSGRCRRPSRGSG